MTTPAPAAPAATEPALVMEGVVAGYGGGDVLRGVTFDGARGVHHLRGGAERRGQVHA